jgi:hypothetical protein
VYFLAQSTYALSNGASTIRPIVLRIRPDADDLELVSCIPPGADHGLIDHDNSFLWAAGITSSDTGVFVARQVNSSQFGFVHPTVVKVAP